MSRTKVASTSTSQVTLAEANRKKKKKEKSIQRGHGTHLPVHSFGESRMKGWPEWKRVQCARSASWI